MRKRNFKFPGSRALKRDAGAGVALGLVSIPDGLAAGILAGVSPVAVLIADVPEIGSPTTAEAALTTLAVMTGAVMLTLGVLRLGSLVRFVLLESVEQLRGIATKISSPRSAHAAVALAAFMFVAGTAAMLSMPMNVGP